MPDFEHPPASRLITDAVLLNREGGEYEDSEETYEEQSKWDRWGEALHKAEHTGQVRVFKMPLNADGSVAVAKVGAKQVHLATFAYDQYTYDDLMDIIRARFMLPGEYAAIRLMGISPGQKGVKFNQVVELQRAKEEKKEGGSQSLELTELLRIIQQDRQQMREWMEGRPPVPVVTTQMGNVVPSSTVEMMKIWAPIVGPIMTAIVGGMMNRKESGGLGDMISAVRELRDLAGVGENNNDSGDLANIIKSVSPALPAIAQIIANGTQRATPPRRQLAAPTRAPNPAPRPQAQTQSPPIQPPPSPGGPKDQEMLTQLVSQLEQLKPAAESNADTDEMTKLVFSMMPDDPELDASLYNFLEDPQNIGRIAIMSPVVKEYPEWFERLRVSMLAAFDPDDVTTPRTG